MREVIQQAEGNISKLAAILEVSRPTVYAWLDQLELSDLVGVSSSLSLDRLDDVYSKDSQASKPGQDVESTEKYVKPRLVDATSIRTVSSVMPQQDLRMQRSVLVSDSRWKWAKHRGVDSNKTVSDIVEEALDLLRSKIEAEHGERRRASPVEGADDE
jgi:transposase-like protein